MHHCACVRLYDVAEDQILRQSNLEREGTEGPFVLSVLQCAGYHLKAVA